MLQEKAQEDFMADVIQNRLALTEEQLSAKMQAIAAIKLETHGNRVTNAFQSHTCCSTP